MTCRYSENDVALYVEGDLTDCEDRRFEQHVRECQSCRELAEELRESQAVFKSLRQDVISPAVIGEVRGRVLAEVAAASSRRPWGRWFYAVAGIVLVITIGVSFWNAYFYSPPRRGGEAAPSTERREAAETAQTGWSDRGNASVELTTPALRATPPFQGGERKHIKSSKTKQTMVKLLTDDPNVVIYWLIDQNGG